MLVAWFALHQASVFCGRGVVGTAQASGVLGLQDCMSQSICSSGSLLHLVFMGLTPNVTAPRRRQSLAAGVAVGSHKAQVTSVSCRCSLLQAPGEGGRAADPSPASQLHPCSIPRPADAAASLQHPLSCPGMRARCASRV